MKKYQIRISADGLILIFVKECETIDNVLAFAKSEAVRLFSTPCGSMEIIEILDNPMVDAFKQICPKMEAEGNAVQK